MDKPWLKKKTYWDGKCNDLFSEIIKMRDGYICQETRATRGLQTAHIVSRSYKATKFDFDNAITLKAGRHKWYTHHPIEWKAFIDEKFGKGYYEKMEKRALQLCKRTLSDLKELYEKLKAIRDSWNHSEGRFEIRTNPGRTRSKGEFKRLVYGGAG